MKTKTKKTENKVKELNNLLDSCINEEALNRIVKQEDKTELNKLMSILSKVK